MNPHLKRPKQLQPQLPNNRLVNQFHSYADSSQRANPYSNNNMIAQNPNFTSRDPQFYNRIQMAKLEQIKRAKKIEDLGLRNMLINVRGVGYRLDHPHEK